MLGEAFRQGGDIVVELVTEGIDITKGCGYVLGIGGGQRVLEVIALARGALADAETAFTDARPPRRGVGRCARRAPARIALG